MVFFMCWPVSNLTRFAAIVPIAQSTLDSARQNEQQKKCTSPFNLKLSFADWAFVHLVGALAA
jgi:hypothetical protein